MPLRGPVVTVASKLMNVLSFVYLSWLAPQGRDPGVATASRRLCYFSSMSLALAFVSALTLATVHTLRAATGCTRGLLRATPVI